MKLYNQCELHTTMLNGFETMFNALQQSLMYLKRWAKPNAYTLSTFVLVN